MMYRITKELTLKAYYVGTEWQTGLSGQVRLSHIANGLPQESCVCARGINKCFVKPYDFERLTLRKQQEGRVRNRIRLQIQHWVSWRS